MNQQKHISILADFSQLGALNVNTRPSHCVAMNVRYRLDGRLLSKICSIINLTCLSTSVCECHNVMITQQL